MTDSEMINNLGGTQRVATMLGFKKARVSHWKRRGIPAKIKLENPALFLPDHQIKK